MLSAQCGDRMPAPPSTSARSCAGKNASASASPTASRASAAASRTACSPRSRAPASRTLSPAWRKPIPRTCRCSSFLAALLPERQYIRPTFRAAEVFRPVTKWSAFVTTAKEIPDVMRRAYQAMRSGKPGPMMVEVQTEVFDEEFEGPLDYKPVPVAARRARSGGGERSGARAARGQKPAAVGRPRRPLRRGGRAARGACRTDPGAGRGDQPGQERHSRHASARPGRRDALALQGVMPPSWHAPTWCSRSDRASPRHRSAPRCRQARP